MWYVADLIFAQLERMGKSSVKCESCCVLFQTDSALEAYDKSLIWAKEHETDSLFHFVGVANLWRVDDEIGDGTEIGGNFFDEEDFWDRRAEFIPAKEELSAIKWELNEDVPIGELMTEKQLQNMKEIFGEE